jgi:hypothetical protein
MFLPVITVGTAMLNRDSEKRAKEDHKTYGGSSIS